MKSADALTYCRQLLFEQRLTNFWANAERLRLVATLERWKLIPGWWDDSQMAGAERQRWREEVEHERLASLERSKRDARQIRSRLDAANGQISSLLADNEALRMELRPWGVGAAYVSKIHTRPSGWTRV